MNDGAGQGAAVKSMGALIDRLRRLSTGPGRKDGAFDDWLKQDDTPSFLTDDAREDENLIKNPSTQK